MQQRDNYSTVTHFYDFFFFFFFGAVQKSAVMSKLTGFIQAVMLLYQMLLFHSKLHQINYFVATAHFQFQLC